MRVSPQGILGKVPVFDSVGALLSASVGASLLAGSPERIFSDKAALGAAVGLAAYAMCRAAFFLLATGLPTVGCTESQAGPYPKLVRSYRLRAQRLRLACRLILLATLISLLGGVWLFLYADVVARDATRGFDARQLDSRLSRYMDVWAKHLEQAGISPHSSENAQELRLMASELKAEIRAGADRVAQAQGANQSLVSSLSTRIGTLVLLLFLVQILVSLYRYQTRLAAFYDARADVLELLTPATGLGFEQLIQLTFPDKLDFIKQEKAPADYALELAKQIIERSERNERR